MIPPEKQALLRVLQRHVERLGRRCNQLDRISRRYAQGRLALVAAGVTASFLAFQQNPTWGWATLVGFAAAFAVVARYHNRVEDSLTRHRRWRQIKATHVARMTLDWSALPPPVETTVETEHPFGGDLNLTGSRSVHHLLNTATSQGGGERLLQWLFQSVPDLDAIRSRHARVRELIPRATFRDRLTLFGLLSTENPDARWDGEALLRWLHRRPSSQTFVPSLILLGGLAVLNVVLIGLWLTASMAPYWVFSLAAYVGIYFHKHQRLRDVFDEAYHLQKTLRAFRSVLLYLENYRYGSCPHIAALCEPFWNAEIKPSAYLKRIARIAAAASTSKNELIGPLLNLLGPWDLFFAYRLEQYKAAFKNDLPVWLETWYELEATCALATFAELHPHYTFPTLTPPQQEPVFQGQRLGHPLIPDEEKVCNDFTIDALGEVAIVTGSNMSGKSTFLRTLGVNLCLAFAGAPVDASTLQTVPFRLFTSLNVSDSIQDGISYFYAEVRRLKVLLQALQHDHPLPLFFLIDEIFRGTNNRERFIGSRAYLRALAGSHGTGAISTHDLELIHLEEEIAAIRNYHFREEVEAGRMTFDYRLRPGPCPTTNALKIMQQEGLPVEHKQTESVKEET